MNIIDCAYNSNINFLEFIDHIEEVDENEDNYCLISKEELLPDSIKLTCGHKFNYIPLFLEIFNQKFKLYCYSKSKATLFKCPYCRQEEHTLLPEYKSDDYELIKIYNVNTDDPKYTLITCGNDSLYSSGSGGVYYKTISIEGTCEFKSKGNIECTCKNSSGIVKLCLIDNKYYCWRHFGLKNKQLFGNTKYVCPIIKKCENSTKVNEKVKTKTQSKVETEVELSPLFCQAVIQNGKNKGLQCKNKQKIGEFCKCHTSKEKEINKT